LEAALWAVPTWDLTIEGANRVRHLAIKTAVLFLAAVTLVLGTRSLASSPNAKRFHAAAEYDNTSHELALHLSETNESPSACDLVVTRLEYFSELKTLNIDLKPDLCQIDNYGIRQGRVKWQVPLPLRSEGALVLHVNGEVIGNIQLSPTGAVVTQQ
jgi:hypothetical protein